MAALGKEEGNMKSAKRWRLLAVVLAVGVLGCVWAALGPGRTDAASYFYANQVFWVESTGWHCEYIADWSTHQDQWVDWQYGTTYFSWHLPWQAWNSFYIYDYTSGRWTEVLHLYDQPL